MKIKVSTLLRRTFIQPWQDGTRSFLMLATMPGLFGAGLVGLALAYSMAGYGITTTTLFHAFRMGLVGFVVIPGCFWILTLQTGRWILALIQLIGTLLLLLDRSSALFNGLGWMLTAGPFYTLYSQRNSVALSHDNHGNDVALLNYLQVIVVCLGTFLGGLLLKLDLYACAMTLSGLCLLVSTFLCAKRLPHENKLASAVNLLGFKKPANRLSFMVAIVYALIDNGLPTWMRLIGLSPLSTGTSLAMRPILGAILTPAAGYLIQKGGLGAGRIGGAGLVAGWIVMGFAVVQPWLLLPGLAFLTVGIGLIAPMEVAYWFKRRTSQAIIAREWILAGGRLVALPVMIPLIFLAPATFPVLGVLSGALFIIGSKAKRKRA